MSVEPVENVTIGRKLNETIKAGDMVVVRETESVRKRATEDYGFCLSGSSGKFIEVWGKNTLAIKFRDRWGFYHTVGCNRRNLKKI